jgi:hypothetical protein
MPVIRVLGFATILLVACFLVHRVVRAIRTGTVDTAWGDLTRYGEPVRFWLVVSVCGLYGAAATALVCFLAFMKLRS